MQPALGVDGLLDVREEVGSVLDLVQDHGGRKRGEEASWILRRGRLHVGSLEGDVAVCLSEQLPEERRLAGLPRARQDDVRELAGRPANDGLEGSPDLLNHYLDILHYKCKIAR